MHANRRKSKCLKFGNHRKYETNNPDSAIGTPAVIHSFVERVRQTAQDSPYEALCAVAKGRTPETVFDNAYKRISVAFWQDYQIRLPVPPRKPWSVASLPATLLLSRRNGPEDGSDSNGGRRPNQAIYRGRREHDTAAPKIPRGARRGDGDALCNWQKRQKSKRRAIERGYVTTTCG